MKLKSPGGPSYRTAPSRIRLAPSAASVTGVPPSIIIWHIVGNWPFLQESHGVEGPSGPRVFLNQVPYPSSANDSYTPYTTPSSRAQLGDGLPVHITNICRLSDGRVVFQIGYEYQ